MAKTVVFDFDGVIHSYTSGWLGETTIPDPPVPGIREALKEIHGAGYEVVVVSTRCATAKGKGAIEAWLYNNGLREYIDKVCKEKPPAIAYIDDRAICFDGHPETLLKKIQNFQPWYKTPTLTPPNDPRMINADKLAKRIAGHSNYHGDSILAAIYCAAEGKENDAPIRPIETTPNEWVSVEERLPSNMDDVIVVVRDKGECWTMTGYYSSMSKKWYAVFNGQDTQMDVLFWMPLPAPPDRRPTEGEEGDVNRG